MDGLGVVADADLAGWPGDARTVARAPMMVSCPMVTPGPMKASRRSTRRPPARRVGDQGHVAGIVVAAGEVGELADVAAAAVWIGPGEAMMARLAIAALGVHRQVPRMMDPHGPGDPRGGVERGAEQAQQPPAEPVPALQRAAHQRLAHVVPDGFPKALAPRCAPSICSTARAGIGPEAVSSVWRCRLLLRHRAGLLLGPTARRSINLSADCGAGTSH